jgi:lysophospholipase L1-like esterase
LINSAINTGREAQFLANGRLYDFSPEGLKAFTNSEKVRVVAGRGACLGGVANSGTTYTRQETRMKIFFGSSPCRDIQLVFTNSTSAGSASEVVGPNAITIEAALETITPSAFVTVTFNGGALTAVLQPGGTVVSDPIPMSFAANAQAWLRTGLVVTAGQSWPRTSMFAISGESMYESTEATSQVQQTGAMLIRNGQAGGGGYIPSAIIGKTADPIPAVALVGDSIMAGTIGDSSSNVTGLRGFFAKGLVLPDGSTLPFTLLARASEQAVYCTSVGNFRRRFNYDYCTHAIVNYGTNDIAAGATLVQIQGYLTEIWAQLKARNIKVYHSLILPRTTSSDTFATVANQTPATGFAKNGIRDQLNAWIRLQVGTLIDGIIDPNVIAEDQTLGNRWVANGVASSITADGIHPNVAGSLTLAPAVQAVVKDFKV